MRVWDLHDVDYRVVQDEDEERAAFDEGWSLTPDCPHESSDNVLEMKRRGRPPKLKEA